MKKMIGRILSVFKNKNGKEFQFNDIYRACRSASNELGEYCKVEGLNK